jgi:S-DNA-T family DNA segregation ATPase FtsK/SpoIIIE
MDIVPKTLLTSERMNQIAGLLLLVLGLVSLLSILSYTSLDATWFHRQPAELSTQNWMGRVGATMAEAIVQLFGAASFLLPFAMGIFGWSRLRPGRKEISWARVAGYGTLALSLCALLHLLYDPIVYGGDSFKPGGYLGSEVAGVLVAMLNTVGALIFSATVLLVALILMTRFSLLRWLELAAKSLANAAAGAMPIVKEWWDKRRRGRRPWAATSPPEPRIEAEEPERRPSITLEREAAAESVEPVAKPKPVKKERPAEKKEPEQQKLPIAEAQRGFSLPSLDLLTKPEPQSREGEERLLERAKQITEKFNEFSMEGSVVAIHPGPVVTTFEFRPEAGIKYSRITSMTEDLSLALKAESVRVERLAGRSTIGIEVPNLQQETIYPYELLSSKAFSESRSKLTIALGKDIHGEVFTTELDRMPHLLIAGATGAGKSVCLNNMIVSMMYKTTPDELRFIMIDTKMIELGVYSDIPHLLVPVVTDPKKAAVGLQWAVKEMESRYRKLAAVGVRNLAQFNALLEEEPDRTMEDPKGGDPIKLTRLAYIVIVIDELADLMMVASSEVEEAVMRLAQMARAVGIHLILATQRPSVDVITGTVKANFPSRIAFRVSQRVDSRTIIDQQGAEHLLGRGDMLFLTSGSARVKRLHGGFITEPEINRICSYLKKMAKPVFDETVLAEPEEQPGAFENGEQDEAYFDAVRTVINEGKCSITLIQRRLSLGYARAARIVDMMEQAGVVGPGEGSKPREVLVGPEILERIESP